MTPPELSEGSGLPGWLRRNAGLALVAVGLLARLPSLLVGVEHYGDAPVRIEAAERWIASPHVWRGFGEAFQYGPLHLSLLGAAVKLGGRFAGPRLLSLGFGLFGIWLLHRLARRAVSAPAALAAGLALALSPIHVQASTTGASEAIFLSLLLASVSLVFAARADANAAGPRLALAGAILGAASLVRYDGLLYVALLSGLLAWDAAAGRLSNAEAKQPDRPGPSGRVAGLLAFAACAAVLPALWFWRCAAVDGHAFAALRHIDQDHRALAAAAVQWMGEARYRLYCLGYWPAAVLIVCTPVAGLLATFGAFRALWRLARALPRPPTDAQALALLAWVPALYFTIRGAVLVDFRPMARFALVAGALSLPLGWDVLVELAGLPGRSRSRPLRKLAGLAAIVLVGSPVALALAAVGRSGSLAEWARPMSPISSAPPGIEDAARWLRRTAGPSDVVLLDGTWHYLDIVLAFDANLPEAQLVRRAWTNFDAKLEKLTPTLAILLEGGSLRAAPGAAQAVDGAPSFSFRGLRFCADGHFPGASVYRRCDQPGPSIR